MVESNRLYRRKKISIPVTFLPDEFPLVASRTESLPMTAFGTVIRDSYGAITKNTSIEGMCFLTEKKLEPGTDIEIRMVDFNPIPMGSGNTTTCLAKVVWCRTASKTEHQNCYEIGAIRKHKSDLPILNMGNRHFASIKCM